MNKPEPSNPPPIAPAPPEMAQGWGAGHLTASENLSPVTPGAPSPCHSLDSEACEAPLAPAPNPADASSRLIRQLEAISTDPRQPDAVRRFAATRLERLRSSTARRASLAPALALIEQAKEPERIAKRELAKIERLTRENDGKPPLLKPGD